MNNHVLRFLIVPALLLICYLPTEAQQDASNSTANPNTPLQNDAADKALKLRLEKLVSDSISMVKKNENLIFERISLSKDTLSKFKIISDCKKRIAELEKDASKSKNLKELNASQKLDIERLENKLKTCQGEMKEMNDGHKRIQDDKTATQKKINDEFNDRLKRLQDEKALLQQIIDKFEPIRNEILFLKQSKITEIIDSVHALGKKVDFTAEINAPDNFDALLLALRNEILSFKTKYGGDKLNLASTELDEYESCRVTVKKAKEVLKSHYNKATVDENIQAIQRIPLKYLTEKAADDLKRLSEWLSRYCAMHQEAMGVLNLIEETSLLSDDGRHKQLKKTIGKMDDYPFLNKELKRKDENLKYKCAVHPEGDCN
jgi:hypothetical protein